MRIALLGGTGFIGPHIAAALRSGGHEPMILSRSGGVDRRNPSSVAAAIGDAAALIDLIAYDATSTTPLLDALAGRVGRYVLISSADVYRNYAVLRRLECSAPLALLDEDAPLRTRLYPHRRDSPRAAHDPNAWQDTYDKIPIEKSARARSTDMETTILRLPMVYGPDDKQQRFLWITQPMRAGADISAPRAWLDAVMTYGHVENVAAAIAHAAILPQAANSTFNIGEAPQSHRVCVGRFAAVAGWRGAVLEDETAPIATLLSSLDLSVPLALDTSRIRARLGYCEVLSLDSALRSVL